MVGKLVFVVGGGERDVEKEGQDPVFPCVGLFTCCLSILMT